MLLELNWHQWTDVHVMPGSLFEVGGDYSGNVNDEVSVVLQYLGE
jgi:hypothetical protein